MKRYRMARVNGVTQFIPATHTTILTLLRKHSPDGTTRTRRQTSDIAYYSIYRHLKDERLSWPSWLTHSGQLTHIRGHPSALQKNGFESMTGALPKWGGQQTEYSGNECGEGLTFPNYRGRVQEGKIVGSTSNSSDGHFRTNV